MSSATVYVQAQSSEVRLLFPSPFTPLSALFECILSLVFNAPEVMVVVLNSVPVLIFFPLGAPLKANAN